jgi:hypothetical protein
MTQLNENERKKKEKMDSQTLRLLSALLLLPTL